MRQGDDSIKFYGKEFYGGYFKIYLDILKQSYLLLLTSQFGGSPSITFGDTVKTIQSQTLSFNFRLRLH